MRAVVERRVVGVDCAVAHPLDREFQNLRGDAAQGRRCPLADLDGGGTDDRSSGGQQFDERLGMVAGAAAILYPDAEAHTARHVTLHRASNTLPVAEAFDDLVETAPKIAVNSAVTRLKRLADGKQVLAAEIIGVDPEPPRNH